MRPVLNYTTTIDASKTLAEIQAILASHGVKAMAISFGPGGRPDALSFTVGTPHGDRSYRLPARAEACHEALLALHREGKVRKGQATPEQAARVAWRTIKDWVEAKLAIVALGMVSLDEVFLPYMLVGGGKTAYEAFASGRRLSLPPPRET